MKRTFTLLFLAAAMASQAQPVLVNTMTPPPVGGSDSIYTAAGSVAPGAGGAAVTWNLSALTPVLYGTVSIVTLSSTPYASTFPTATFCSKITPTGAGTTTYGYERLSSTGWEYLATNYSGPGTGSDYTPNPESGLEFPMNYLDLFTDTYQKVSSSPGSVDISYDGYGTLVTPFGTYNNIVRIKKYWGPGDYDYNWYTTTPYLTIVANYHAQSNSFVVVNDRAGMIPTAVQSATVENSVALFPNPMVSAATLSVGSGITNGRLMITDVAGKVVRQESVSGEQTLIKRGDLQSGFYLYEVLDNNNEKIKTGKLLVQ
jgi:hypothetical protein